MRKKLIRHGNSYALIIDKPILELLRIDPETPLEVSTDGRSILISPEGVGENDGAFENAVRRVHERFGDAMRRLAE